MAEKREYKMFEYQGGYNTLDSNKAYSNSFTGYRVSAGSLGITSDPRTANILKDVSAKLSSGAKHVELTLVTPELFDSVPKQHLKEMNELAKLTGVDVSVHGPVMDSAGFDRNGFSELNRQASERRILDVIQRSNEINPKGNVPVIFHSAEGISGSEWKTLGDAMGKTPREARKLIAIERDTGKMIPLEFEKRYYPGGEEGKVQEVEYSPKENLKIVNHTQWDNDITQIEFQRENAERIMQDVNQIFHQRLGQINESRIRGKSYEENISPEEHAQLNKLQFATEYIEEAEKKAKSDFSKAYDLAKKDNDKESIEFLESVSKQYGEALGMNGDKITPYSLDPKVRSEALGLLSNNLRRIQPKMFVSIEDFATDKSSQTFGNAAFQAYKKLKDKAPVIYIENPPAGFGLSTGEDLKNLVVASRKKFVENAVAEGISESEAKRQAEKLIGATWDVGHINMLRKQGFSDKDVVEETKKIAPYVKHVHLSDNFGYEHTELPMGMGNVPLKEIMDRLGEKGFEGKKIIEAGQWWQHFQTNPLRESLEGMGASIYSGGGAGTPYWNQSMGFYQNYSGGFGRMLPGINYSTFGAGFSQLPSELGGEVGGGQGSRMSGRGME